MSDPPAARRESNVDMTPAAAAAASSESAAQSAAAAAASAASAAPAASTAAAASTASQPAARPATVPTSDASAQLVSYHEAPSGDAAGVLGCSHYKRGCLVRAPCCPTFFPCRLCHDEHPRPPKLDHAIDRKAIDAMVCMVCTREGRGAGVQQPAKECQDCKTTLAGYYCDVCHLWDDGGHAIFHCDGCGICRRGKRDEFFHCDRCGCCCAIGTRDSHKCLQDATKRDCPVCMADMFTGREPVSFLPCGHALHVSCMQQLIRSRATSCPLCKKSIHEADEEWIAQLDSIVSATPMPPEYADWRAKILCNDCLAKCEVPWRIDGLHKCASCKSYNTDVLKRMQPEGGSSGADAAGGGAASAAASAASLEAWIAAARAAGTHRQSGDADDDEEGEDDEDGEDDEGWEDEEGEDGEEDEEDEEDEADPAPAEDASKPADAAEEAPQ